MNPQTGQSCKRSRGAADRGVAIRIYLDGTQFAEREPVKVFLDCPSSEFLGQAAA